MTIVVIAPSSALSIPSKAPSVAQVPIGGLGAGRRIAGFCVDEHRREPVIKPGREKDITALLAPHRTGQSLAGWPGWTLGNIAVAKSAIRVFANGPRGATATVALTWVGCADANQRHSASFALEVQGESGPVDVLVDAIVRNDPGGFWRSFSVPEALRQRAERPDEAGVEAGAGHDPRHGNVGALNTQNGVVVLVFLLAFLAWLVASRGLGKQLRLGPSSPGAASTWAWLLGLTAVGALLRWAVDPTFIREAYVFPNVAWQDGDWELVTESGLSAYPKGPETITYLLGPLLSDDPYEAWFQVRRLLGILTIPWAFVAGASLFRRRAAGLVVAATLAFLPHHIRISTTESTHVDLIFFGTAALALILVAARSGHLTAILAALVTAAATVFTRPEGAVVGLGLAIVALGAGPGIRKRYRDPWVIMAFAALVYLIAPSLAVIVTDGAAESFAPTSKGTESLGLGALWRVAATLVIPDGRNALWDPHIAPVWFYPLMVFGAVGLWVHRQRAIAVGLVAIVLSYLFVYSGLPPAVTVWRMGRYHAALLVGAVPLAGAGIWLLCSRFEGLKAARRRVAVACLLGAIGCAMWWPAIRSLDRDWQQAHRYVIALGRAHDALLSVDGVRVVVPDNRRRFLDMSPRTDIVPLTRQRQSIENGVTIAEALERLHRKQPPTAPVYYLESAYCYLAVAPGESKNPQCKAMWETFELTPVATRDMSAEAFLSMYVQWRAPVPWRLGLYRVGARKQSPEAAGASLPKPLGKNVKQSLGIVAPYGHGTGRQMMPADPPL